MPVLLKKNYNRPIVDVEDEIRSRLLRRDTGSFLFVVPTKRKLRELQRQFLRVIPQGVAPSLNLFTLETLASRLYLLLCPPKRFLAGPGQAVLMNEAIRAVGSSFGYFRVRGASQRLPKGTFQKIIGVINEMRDKGVYRTALLAEAETADGQEQAK